MPDQLLPHPLLAEMFRFRPFPQGDPIPPWIFKKLDKAISFAWHWSIWSYGRASSMRK
jgi:hypothetical protein